MAFSMKDFSLEGKIADHRRFLRHRHGDRKGLRGGGRDDLL